MDQQKKRRGENWSAEEKELLRQLIAQSANIIENKSTKTSANILKVKEWKSIMTKLNELTGKNRTDAELKLAWKRMKLAAKANLSSHRQLQMQTGGGEKPPSPSPDDLAIMAIAPFDFMVEVNNYDSDAIPTEITDSRPQSNVNDDAIPGTSHDPLIVIEVEEDTEAGIPDIAVDQGEPEDIVVSPEIINRPKKTKKGSQHLDIIRESILESNNNFKKRQIKMMEIEHSYNIKIAKLKIKKLELEIALLESKKNTNE